MRRLLATVMLCLMMVTASACGDMNPAYDDDAELAQSGDSSSATMSSYMSSRHELSLSVGSFTGTKTIWQYDAVREVEVEFSYMLSVTDGGKAKLILITPDDEVVTLVENADHTVSDEWQRQTVKLRPGNNRIKLVGYDGPKLELKLRVDVGELDW